MNNTTLAGENARDELYDDPAVITHSLDSSLSKEYTLHKNAVGSQNRSLYVGAGGGLRPSLRAADSHAAGGIRQGARQSIVIKSFDAGKGNSTGRKNLESIK